MISLPIWLAWLFLVLGAVGSLSSVIGFVLSVYVIRRERVIQTEVETIIADEGAKR